MQPLCRTLVLALVSAGPLAAQTTLTADAGVNSQYQWRGLTITNRLVVQPDVILAVPLPAFTLTAGAWASIEGGRYDDASKHISENAGAGAKVAEYDLWVEASRKFGAVTLTVGALTYSFPNDSGTTPAANTAEAYAKLVAASPLSPSFAVWHDVRTVSGSYAEAGLAQGIGRVRLAATAGWNLGQAIGDGGTGGYFARRGFTHTDVAASTSWTANGLTVAPAVHVLLGSDHNTRIAAPGRVAGAKLWFGTTVSWARPLTK